MLENIQNTKWDYIVVGSGPSGGRLAHDLTSHGAKVLLLEAGQHFKSQDFPKPEIQSSSQLFWGGGVELNHDARLGFLRAKCVGGTSIVNQALLDRFDDFIWKEWSSLTGLSFSEKNFEPYYETVEKSISLEKIPDRHFGQNTKLFIQAFSKKHLGWTALRRGQKDCGIDQGNDCISCLGGCPRSSKQSTLVTSVEPALKKGLTLLANCEVQSVKESKDQIQVQSILKVEGKAEKISLNAKNIILAAGSFGTTKILLQSGFQEKNKTLGTGLSCHPQYMTYSLFEKPVDSFKGAFQAVKSYDPKLREMGFKFENVFAPPIATSMLVSGFGKQHQDVMKNFRFMASMEVAIRDQASGTMKVLSNGKTLVNKSLTAQDQQRMNHGLTLIDEMFSSVGAQKIIRCPQAFGLHLMGGCALGSDESKSVVSPEFKVHGSKRIFISDSSIFPSAPGINPSLTIMAFGVQAMPHLLKAVSL